MTVEFNTQGTHTSVFNKALKGEFIQKMTVFTFVNGQGVARGEVYNHTTRKAFLYDLTNDTVKVYNLEEHFEFQIENLKMECERRNIDLFEVTHEGGSEWLVYVKNRFDLDRHQFVVVASDSEEALAKAEAAHFAKTGLGSTWSNVEGMFVNE